MGTGQVGRVRQVGQVRRVRQMGQVGRVRQVEQVRQGAHWALGTIVMVHLAISVLHGRAHSGAQVPLSPAATLFVYLVILAGPLAGLAISRWRSTAGGWIVAASLGGALVFGLINHFIIAGPDHVDHVTAEWRTLFGVTAALLLVTEAAGVAIVVWSAMQPSRRT
jgi:hypothetical protein